MNIKAAPGVFDILPKDPKEKWRHSHLWKHVEKVMREAATQYGFQEIRTPIFEKTELFLRGVGETTDIVTKEMYTFQDKGNRSLTLRPEGTAPVARAFLEHHLGHEAPIQKFYYIGPMFRYERSQAGRYRQHHQFGVEVIGASSPEQDAELIDLLYTIYSRLGLRHLKVMVNSLGNSDCRKRYKKALQCFLEQYFNRLSKESQGRLQKNPLRILDSKDPNDIEILAEAPSILNFLSETCAEHFEKVLKLLNALNIPYEINDRIVRGLDYYNRTVFEVVAEELGAQNSVGGGGRYDDLMMMLGGPEVAATGFAAGIERIIQTMLAQNVAVSEPLAPALYLIPLGEEAKKACFVILHDLRRENLIVEMDFSGRKLGKVMQYADRIRAQFVAVVGENELRSEKVELKNMKTGEKVVAPLYHLARLLRIEVEGDDLMRVLEAISTPFEQSLEAQFFIKKLEKSIANTKHLTQNLESAIKKIKGIL